MYTKPEAKFLSGAVKTYKGRKANFPALPIHFLSHTYGSSWSYTVPVEGQRAYEVALGFAEVYNVACKKPSNSGYRIFEATVGNHTATVDVMGDVGCGEPMERVFRKVAPVDGKIKVIFKSISQKAMLSTLCYRKDLAPRPSPSPPLSSPSPSSSLAALVSSSPSASVAASPSPAILSSPQASSTVTFIAPGKRFQCVNFGPKLDMYTKFKWASVKGKTTLFQRSGVSKGTSLPDSYRYNLFGKKWSYSLNVSTSNPQNIVLGYAELLPKACLSERDGAFRVFTVQIGNTIQTVDVMRSVGCGSVHQIGFKNISPNDSTIDIHLSASSNSAMLSVVCFKDAPFANPSPEPSASTSGNPYNMIPSASAEGEESTSAIPSAALPSGKPERGNGSGKGKSQTPVPSVSVSMYPDVSASPSSGGQDVLVGKGPIIEDGGESDPGPSQSMAPNGAMRSSPSPQATLVKVPSEQGVDGERNATFVGPSATPRATASAPGGAIIIPSVPSTGASPVPSQIFTPVVASSGTVAILPASTKNPRASPGSVEPIPSSSPMQVTASPTKLPSVSPATANTPVSTPSAIASASGSVTQPLESTSPAGFEILPPVPNGSQPPSGTTTSPRPSTTITQNQIVIPPAGSPTVSPTLMPNPAATVSITTPTPPAQSSNPIATPTPVITVPPSAPSSAPTTAAQPSVSAASSITAATPTAASSSGVGIPPPTGVVSPDPDGDPNSGESATPAASPSQATSDSGANSVIVSSESTAPSRNPNPSVPVAASPRPPLEVPENSTGIIEVNGEGSDGQRVPSILLPQFKEIDTTPLGNGFAIGMGIFGSLLVLLLLLCLFFAIFRGGGAAYSYNSYLSDKPAEYDPSQAGLNPGSGSYNKNQSSYRNGAEGGYGSLPANTYDSGADPQNESFRFEMPSTGVGAVQSTEYASAAPDAYAEYTSLNLMEASGYGSPTMQTDDNHEDPGTMTMDTRGSNSLGIDYQDSRAAIFRQEDTDALDEAEFYEGGLDGKTYAEPGVATGDSQEDTFYGTLMPQTGYAEQEESPAYSDYYESNTVEEPEGQSYAGDSASPHAGMRHGIRGYRAESDDEGADRLDGNPFDNLPSSKIYGGDTIERESGSSHMTPVEMQSPYETDMNIDADISDTGNGPQWPSQMDMGPMTASERKRVLSNRVKTDSEILSTPGYEKRGSDNNGPSVKERMEHMDLGSQISNDGPWPQWWIDRNNGSQMMQQSKAAEQPTSSQGSYSNSDIDAKENSSVHSNVMQGSHMYTTSQAKNILRDTNNSSEGSHVIPDSNWLRRQSGKSDGVQQKRGNNPHFDELRKRREPYVKSVANRLSTGPAYLLAQQASR